MKPRSSETILDQSYLETRAKLLEIAAILDRIDRAKGSQRKLSGDAANRREQLTEAINLLLGESPDRAEQIQKLFSRQYDPDWRAAFDLMPEHASTSASESRES
ncbi:hypothetical protein [Aporhodopirellula aestuarii]|uniref:Uncharacterized protein n=1 Tax=Aporhodopirellula aestuarii TaxID=2950107 RepID=A0ABT0U351_9BACT|nr:hypothetical protein [Aporhodopirellula aestuarii]MCM2371021.1 hypothetical protein [Aporhodopirellula aestuarii]